MTEHPFPARFQQYQDNGFFGPGSPTWRLWAAPTAVLAFQRSVVLEHFDPFLTAAVADQQGIYRDPHGRLDGTLAYFLTVATADGRTAIEVSDHLMKIHAKATGIEPITGKRYSANNPASQLWIHITGWHSVLKCFEMYGPGLSPEEEERYWAECAIAAELQTCKPADIPRSRKEVREYYADVRPQLCSSERAHQGMHYLLRTSRKNAGIPLWAMSRLTAPAVIATLPKWMRRTGGFDQSAAMDKAIVPLARATVRAVSGPKATIAVLKRITPMTAKVMEQHHYGEPPVRAETITPAQARELYGQAA